MLIFSILATLATASEDLVADCQAIWQVETDIRLVDDPLNVSPCDDWSETFYHAGSCSFYCGADQISVQL